MGDCQLKKCRLKMERFRENLVLLKMERTLRVKRDYGTRPTAHSIAEGIDKKYIAFNSERRKCKESYWIYQEFSVKE